MGIAVSVLVGVALTLPISSAAICSVLGLTGLAGGAAVAGCCATDGGLRRHELPGKPLGRSGQPGPGHVHAANAQHRAQSRGSGLRPPSPPPITGPIATCVFKLEMNGAPINSGMGTCGLCGPIGVWSGWVSPSEAALAKGAAALTPAALDWLGLITHPAWCSPPC